MDFLIGQDIESILELTGLSEEELANELGVSRITVSNWVNNRTNISEFVATHRNSSLYMLKFASSDLISREFGVDREWMLTIAYYRGTVRGQLLWGK